MPSVYVNFFAVASIVPATMSLLIAGILMSMPERSSATRRLGQAFAALFVWNSAYAVSFAVYEPVAGYHRWATVLGSQLALILFTRFLFHYPRLSRPRLADTVFTVQLLVITILDGIVFYRSLGADYLFRVSAEYWDLRINQESRVLGLVLLILAVIFLVVGIARVLRTKGRERATLMGIIATVFGVAMSAGLANSLSREGKVDFAVFVSIYSAAAVLANFLIFVIYVNNTSDRSTIMAKIIGISLVTILLMLQVPGYFSLRDRREAYRELRRADLLRALSEGRRPPGLLYLRKYASGRVEMLLEKNPGTAPLPLVRNSPAFSIGRYGEDEDGSAIHFVVLRMTVAGNAGSSAGVYEAGFSYRAYREYMHRAAVRLIWILLVLLLIVLAGYPLFFRGALVAPLNRLLAGVRRVNDGHMDVVVPVRVEDEIGFLSRSFNGMVESIREARERLREYADGLEEKVEERTTELRDSLESIRNLKEQQDGDYFLTSLLLRPLNSNRVQDGNIRVDFIVRQKKKFTFRKWQEEIGGDLCMARSIVLRGQSHTVFMNADAMGKSMQGAGGALVLGAVFAAILERSSLNASSRDLYPERWLKYAFIELQKVFESFDGSMLVSLVMGLVDDDRGLMYYINAEHPWTVLYRGGRASFLEEEVPFRKLGTQGAAEKFRIKILQLEPGDVIVAGSDGRDDVRVMPESGAPYLSDDETAFLRDVQAGQGNLEKISASISERGELTDDLSLLRISFRERESLSKTPMVSDIPGVRRPGATASVAAVLREARELYRRGDFQAGVKLLADLPGEAPVHRLRAMMFLKRGNFRAALESASNYIDTTPGDTEFLFLASVCNRKLGQLEQAADLGERVRLREPFNIRNLLHLARVYDGMKNGHRAGSLAREIVELEPDNEKAAQLLKKSFADG